MDPSDSISSDVFDPANGCRHSSQLSAYYDGELDPASSARLQQHLAGCEDCRRELAELRELSSLAEKIGAEGISAIGLRKIHRRIDADQGYSVLRIAAGLTGLAASVAVIGSVWLSEIPAARPASPFVVIPYRESPAFEVALGRRVEPLPRTDVEIQHEQMFADARLANWMIDGLSRRP